MSFFISPADVTAKGGEVGTLAESIATSVRGGREGMDASTPGLQTPGEFSKMATAWTNHAITLSEKLSLIGDAVTNCGSNHSTNDGDQAECFPR